MAGKIIVVGCCLLVSCVFLFIARNHDEQTPIPFWTGSEDSLKKEIKNLKYYNEQMEKLYKRVSLSFGLCAILEILNGIIALLVLVLLFTIGFYCVYKKYTTLTSTDLYNPMSIKTNETSNFTCFIYLNDLSFY